MYKEPKMRTSKRSKLHKLSKVGIFAGAGAVAVFFVLAFMGVIPIFNNTGINLTKLDYEVPDNAMANSNGIVFINENTLYLKGLRGEGVWDMEFSEPTSYLDASSDIIAAYDELSITALNYNKEQLFTTKIDTPILNLKCGKKYLAVHTAVATEGAEEGTPLSNFIYIYGEQGEQAGRLEFSLREVIDFGFYGDSDMFWVLTIDTSAVVPTSYISTYKSDGTATGSIVINSQIIEKLFVTDNAIFASGINSVTKYSYFGEKMAEEVILGLRPAAYSHTPASLKIAYIPRIKAPRIDSARIFADDLASETLLLPPNVFSVGLTQSRFYAVSDKQLFVYNTQGNAERVSNLGEGFTSGKQLSDNVMILKDKSNTYLLQLT